MIINNACELLPTQVVASWHFFKNKYFVYRGTLFNSLKCNPIPKMEYLVIKTRFYTLQFVNALTAVLYKRVVLVFLNLKIDPDFEIKYK